MAQVMTAKRLAWLRLLRDNGPQERPPHSRVGYDCMQNGWTEWDYKMPDGTTAASYNEMRDAYGDDWYVTGDWSQRRDRLTLLGRTVLEKFETEGDIQTEKQWKSTRQYV